MNKTEKQILKNQAFIMGALQTLLINTDLNIEFDYKKLNENFYDTLLLVEEEAKR